MMKLQVYISDECWTCEETRRIVADIRPRFPQVQIELLNLNGMKRPSTVFAVPTYVLNGRVIFLGNPIRQELHSKLLAAQCRL
jgi:hypothetical protein